MWIRNWNTGENFHIYSWVSKKLATKRRLSVLMNKKLERNLKNFKTVHERILKINMDIFRRIIILAIYALNKWNYCSSIKNCKKSLMKLENEELEKL